MPETSYALHNSLLLFCSLKGIILDFIFENVLGKKIPKMPPGMSANRKLC